MIVEHLEEERKDKTNTIKEENYINKSKEEFLNKQEITSKQPEPAIKERKSENISTSSNAPKLDDEVIPVYKGVFPNKDEIIVSSSDAGSYVRIDVTIDGSGVTEGDIANSEEVYQIQEIEAKKDAIPIAFQNTLQKPGYYDQDSEQTNKRKSAKASSELSSLSMAATKDEDSRLLDLNTETTGKRSIENENVFTIVEEMPQFPGGEDELQKFLLEKTKYPNKAKEMSVKGIVYTSFVVKKDGKIDNIKIIKGVHKLLDDEAIRVIKLMPKWIPGKNTGKTVDVLFNLPIIFKL